MFQNKLKRHIMKRILTCILAIVLSVQVFAQGRAIAGRVTDAQGRPVPYATVSVKGTSTTVSADENGNFTIQAAPNATLVFSASGFQGTETNIGSHITVNGTLGNQAALSEVVVTALGPTRSREKIGYAATTFRSDEVVRTAPVSPLDGLQGRVAGADISTMGGQPGASSKIILRGYISLQGSNQALIIVDGVPFNNSRLGSGSRGPENVLNAQGGTDFGNGLNDLNPNDIENITILKGAAATSLYGSRAQNGVVLVTTKKGRAGELRVDVSSSAMFSSVGRLPAWQNGWGQGWNGEHWKEENGSWGPRLDGRERLWGSEVDNSRLIKPYTALEDNVRDFYDLGTEFNNSVSLRGGNDNANFFFSYGNVSSNGIIPTDADSYKRNTISLRGQLKASDRFTISSSLNYINKNGKTVSSDDDAAGSSTFENILQIARDIPIVDFKDYKNKFFNINNYFTPYASNPYFSLFENGNQMRSDRFFGNVDLNYKLSNVFNIQWRTGADVTNARLKDWQAVEIPAPNTWRGPNPTNDEGVAFTGAPVGGLTERADFAGEYNSDLFLNYNKDVSDDINLSGFVGANYNERESRLFSSRITELTIPGFYNLSNSSGAVVSKEQISKRRLLGAYGQATVAYKDYLYLALNARNDWSSTLPANARTFFYPGASLSLVVSKIANLAPVSIDFLKLRAAYGKTGRDALPYSLESVLVPGDVLLGFGNLTFPLNNISGFEVSNVIGNNALKPEITTEVELGAEAKFFKNRLGVDVSVYRKVSDGQIINVPIAATTGYRSIITNFGKVENKGIELAVNLVPVKTRDFTWDINYTFTKNKNKVIELPVGLDKVDFATYRDIKMVARAGQPMGLVEAPTYERTEDGKIVATSTGQHSVTTQDVLYGDVQRDFIMGLNNSVSYKDVRLGFTLDYRVGGMMFSRTADLAYFTGNAYKTQYNDRRPYIIPNSVVQNGTDAAGKPIYIENTTPVDVFHFNERYNSATNKGYIYGEYLMPKSFLKLRDITLSYSLPKQWVSRISAQSITLSLIGRNFLIWTPKENLFMDPEVSDIGNDFTSEFGEVAASPSIRSYGVALRIGF